MPHPFKKKRPPFISRPRHKRSDEVIRLKGQIKRDANEYGGLFTSHLILDEPGRPDLYSQWFDFYFPGLDRFTIWNATIVTARKAFWDAAHEFAYQRTAAMLTPEENTAESIMEFKPADFSNTGKILSYELIERKELQYEQFGGLTFFEQWQKLESEIVREAPPTIHERFQLDRRYVYGIGLHIVLDVDVIDRHAIEQAITRFREIGETDWQAANPVARERLPIVSGEFVS
jgi:hypothetical protein